MSLVSAQIGEHLSLDNVTIKGLLTLGGLQARSLSLDNTNLLLANANDIDNPHSVKLINAKIEHWLSLNNSLLEGNIIMENLQVGQHLYMLNANIHRDINLSTAKIGGKLDMEKANIVGELNVYNAKAGIFNYKTNKSVNSCQDSFCRTMSLEIRPRKLDLRGFSVSDSGGIQITTPNPNGLQYQALGGLQMPAFIARRYDDETEQYLSWLKLFLNRTHLNLTSG